MYENLSNWRGRERGLDKEEEEEEEEENTLMPDERIVGKGPVIVDTVTRIVRGASGNPITAHINRWSNGAYTEGMQQNESDDPLDVMVRLGSGDKSMEEIQTKRRREFGQLKDQVKNNP